MLRVLVPVDGSRNSEYALRNVVSEFRRNSAMKVHLLNVQPPLSRHIARFLGRKTRDSFHQDEVEKALWPARQLVEKFGVPYSVHVRVGIKATAIVDEARRLRCDRIVMSTARKTTAWRQRGTDGVAMNKRGLFAYAVSFAPGIHQVRRTTWFAAGVSVRIETALQ